MTFCKLKDIKVRKFGVTLILFFANIDKYSVMKKE